MQIQVLVNVEVTQFDGECNELPDPSVAEPRYERIKEIIESDFDSKLRAGISRPPAQQNDRIWVRVKPVSMIGPVQPVEIDPHRAIAVLRELVKDINDTGGLRSSDQPGWLSSPVAAPEWVDLAVTYENACDVLGIAPLIDEEVKEER